MAQVLSHLPLFARDNVLVGTETSDDAGAVRLADGSALVATIDFITPLVDDPAAFGAIAAANSVSDVYAMGARPLAALSMACFPSKDWPLEVLGEILRGGAAKLGEAGCPVIGGHTIEDAEMKIGYAVVGTVPVDGLWRNSTARPGDELVLTKRLGTGVLAAAARKGVALGDAWPAAVAQMARLNDVPTKVLDAAVVHAATDVSGFGLAGHAAEMARGSGVTIRLDAARIPVLDGALHAARSGYLTAARRQNREYVARDLIAAPSVDPALAEIIHDPQTSGGLLLAVAPGSDAVTRLRAAGCEAHAVGIVESLSRAAIVVE